MNTDKLKNAAYFLERLKPVSPEDWKLMKFPDQESLCCACGFATEADAEHWDAVKQIRKIVNSAFYRGRSVAHLRPEKYPEEYQPKHLTDRESLLNILEEAKTIGL